MLNIAVCGSNGKMGQEVVKAVNSACDMTLVAQIDVLNGQFATIKDAKNSVKIDVLIDFTQPASIYENALDCLNNDIKIVIGTTGLSDSQIDEFISLAEKVQNETVCKSRLTFGITATQPCEINRLADLLPVL